MASPYNLLTVPEVAARLGLSRIRVQQICSDGRLGTMVGGRWLISEEELRQFQQIPRPRGNPNFGKKNLRKDKPSKSLQPNRKKSTIRG